MRRRAAQGGWSLVELAVGLVISALLTGLLFALLPLGRQVATGDRQQRQLTQAEEALLGYGLSHFRLPYADGDGDGRADPNTAAGWLPVEDLGLSSRIRIRYALDASLANDAGRLFVPYLPSSERAKLSPSVNGLDFCIRLLERQRTSVPLASLGMPAAYALAAPADAGHAAVDVASLSIPLPGSAAAAEQALMTRAAGAGELASRMACPQLLARAHGAAQAAMAAYSIKSATRFNRDFRAFDVKIAGLVKSQAESGLAFAGVGLAMGLFDEAMAVILTAAGWPPEGFAIAVGIAEHVVALTSVAYAIAGVVWARNDLDSAIQGEKDAEAALGRIDEHKKKVDQLYADSVLAALRLETGGTRR